MSAKVGVMAWQRPHLICSSTGSSWRFSSDDSGKVALERGKKQPNNALQIKKKKTGRIKLPTRNGHKEVHIILFISYLKNIISPFYSNIILVLADGWLYGQHHFMDLSQMAEVNPNISKGLLTELTV